MSQPTVHRGLNLLETSYQLVRLPAYAVNRTKRLIKSPRIFRADVGLSLHLTESDDPRGAHLENIVLRDLIAWRDAQLERIELVYTVHLRTFRTEYGRKARAGLLLHGGTTIEWLAPDVLSAPWWSVI